MENIRLGILCFFFVSLLLGGSCLKRNNSEVVTIQALQEETSRQLSEMSIQLDLLGKRLGVMEKMRSSESKENATNFEEYTVRRKSFDGWMKEPYGGARVVPSVTNGMNDGFKLYAIQPGSTALKMGLKNGDTVQSINGLLLNSSGSALEAYSSLKIASSLTIGILRRDKPKTLLIHIVN